MAGYGCVRRGQARAPKSIWTWAAILALGAAAAGCSSISSSTSSVSDRFTNLFGSSAAGDQPTKVKGPDPELDCPTIDIRQGASTVQVKATGAAGAPGPLEVPLRLALVREGVEPKTVWTKFYKLPAVVQPGETGTVFTYVEEGLSFPTPSRDELASYVIYVGFDQQMTAPPPKKAKVKKKSR